MARNRLSAQMWLFASCLIVSLLLLFPEAGHSQEQAEQEQAEQDANPISVPNMGAEFWRGVRGRTSVPATTQVSGVETSVLINPMGDYWQKLRSGPVRKYSGWALLAVLGLLALVYLIRGQVKIEHGRSGVLVERWKLWERVVHWYTAILFIILTLSGLSLLFGRTLLIPILGPEAFSWWAITSKVLHNYLGPFFCLGVLISIVTQIRHNLPTLVDLKWFIQGGGMIGNKHPSAGRVNGGEKLFVFWVMATVGIVVCITGVVLDFPGFVDSRETIQQANIVHAVAAVVWIFFTFGHIYLGSVGVEGVFEGIWNGKVDASWAKQHHDLWYEEVAQQPSSRREVKGAVSPESPSPASSR